MANSPNTTVPTMERVDARVAAIPDPVQQRESRRLGELLEAVSGTLSVYLAGTIRGYAAQHDQESA